MLWFLAMVDKPVEAKTTEAHRNLMADVDARAQALWKEGKDSEAAELLRSYEVESGAIARARLMQKLGKAKDAVYGIRRRPFSPPTSHSYKPLWESIDGVLAMTSGDDKYFDVVKDPGSDTLFAAVTYEDSLILYRGVVDYGARTVSWDIWMSYYYPLPLSNPSIAVNGDYVFVGFSADYAGDIDVRVLKVKRSDNSTFLYYIASDTSREDYTTITTDYEEDSWGTFVFGAYWDDTRDSVMFIRIDNADDTTFAAYGGIARAVGDYTTVNRMSMDYFNDGDSSHLFLAYMTNGDTVLLADGSPLGDSWTPRAANFGAGYFPNIKALNGTPYVGVVYSYPYSSTDYDCYIRYSTDAGTSFSQYSCGATTSDELWPTMAFAADTVWVSTLRGDKDTPVDSTTDTMRVIVVALPISGGYWIYRDSINDPSYQYGVLTTWHPVITGPEDTTASKQFLHVAWARRHLNTGDFDVRTDYQFFSIATRAEEAPSVADENVVVVKGGLKVKGSYRIYDISGRLVGSGYTEGSKFIPLRRGSYFVKTRKGLKSVIIR